MIFSVYDIDMINKIAPLHCTSYLKEHGWQEDEHIENKASIWKKDEAEVMVPLKTELADYQLRIGDLLNALQKLEKRTLEAIITNLLNTEADVFRITAFKGDTKASLPLESASILIKRSVDLVSATAQSVINPKSSFQSRMPREVATFLSNLRMGHTERGSFTFTLQTPVSPQITTNQLQLFESDTDIVEEPFERRVMLKLCNLISIASDIANTGNMLSSSVEEGMSANFCEALADITDVCGEKGAYFNMSWASARPIRKEWKIKNNFAIQSATVSVLKEAGKILRQNVPEKNIVIQGYVIHLDSEKPDDGGKIRVQDTLQDRPRVISVELNSDYYKQALNAHGEGQEIRFFGNLEKSGKIPTLTNIYNVEIVKI